MPAPRSVVEGPLKYSKYRQAKRRREKRKTRRRVDEERDRQFPQSKLDCLNEEE